MKTKELIKQLGILTRRWCRNCGGAGGACVQSEQMRLLADEARRDCAKDVEKLIEDTASTEEVRNPDPTVLTLKFASAEMLEYFNILIMDHVDRAFRTSNGWKVEDVDGFEDYQANNKE